jgi:hypothetical protein
MTVSYHERSDAAPSRAAWARCFAAVGLVLALGGCSMPLSGLTDDSPTGAVASKAANDASPDAPRQKPVVALVAAQPGL